MGPKEGHRKADGSDGAIIPQHVGTIIPDTIRTRTFEAHRLTTELL